MTKSERLLFLIQMMRDHKGVSLLEMAHRCRVSPRTLYRDLRTLSRLNYSVRFDNGYRLTRGAVPVQIGVSSDEIQIVRLALRLAPLNHYPWLRRQIFGIDTKLAVSVCENALCDRETHISLEDDFHLLAELPAPKLVDLFLKAIQRKKRVVLGRVGRQVTSPLVPVSVRVAPEGMYFTVTQPGEDERVDIAVAGLSSLRTVPK